MRYKIIVWEAGDIHFWQFMRPIYNASRLVLGQAIHVWIVGADSKILINDLRKQGVVTGLMVPVPAAYLIWSSLYVSASNFRRGPVFSYRIHIGHGHGKIAGFAIKDFLHYDEWFCTGPHQVRRYQRRIEGLDTKLRPKLTPVGYPISDELINGKIDRHMVLDSLNLDSTKPTVLYAPSWEENGSLRWRNTGEQIVEGLLSLGGINVILRLHPMSYTSSRHSQYTYFTGGVDWVARFKRFSDFDTFAHPIEPGSSNQRLLFTADLLVTDFSTIGLDFLPLNRPMVFFNCPDYRPKVLGSGDPIDEKSDQKNEFLMNNLSFNGCRSSGLVCDTVDELLKGVVQELETPERFATQRKSCLSDLLFFPGDASQQAATRLQVLLSGRYS